MSVTSFGNFKILYTITIFFPSSAAYVPTSRTGQKIQWMMEYFSRDEDYDHETIEANCCFPLDYQKLINDEILLDVWPQLKEDLYNSPAETIATFSIAMHQVKKLLS